MTKTLWELQQDRAQEEAAALASISEAASAAADVNINTEANGRLLDVLNRGQQDRLVAEKQVDLLREAREAGKDAYEECHLRYLALVQMRREELLGQLFSKTKSIDPSPLVSASGASEDALRRMARVAATSGNEALGEAVLLAAYEADADVIHELISLLDDADEDEDGPLSEAFSELFAIDGELVTTDVNVLGEELRVRYDSLVPQPSLEDLMPGSPKRGILLGDYAR